MISLIKKYINLFTLISVGALGIVILFPDTFFCPSLSQGDHGLNLYAAEAILQGEKPYRDFIWFYGPLMPYYYSLFLKIFGSNIKSLLLGLIFLRLIAGLLIMALLSRFVPLLLAFSATFWFWVFKYDFFYTFNHLGGITLILATLYFYLSYIDSQKKIFINSSLVTIFILSFVKLNIGLATLAALIISHLFLTSTNKIIKEKINIKFFLIATILLPLIIILCHIIFLNGVPFYTIKQCFQYFGTDPYQSPNLTFKITQPLFYLFDFAMSSWYQLCLSLITIFSFLNLLYLLFKNRFPSQEKNTIIFSLITITIFCIFIFHEFLISGVSYRATWTSSIGLIGIFFIIGLGTKKLSPFLQIILALIITILPLRQLHTNIKTLEHYTMSKHFLSLKKAKIYSENPLPWIETVSSGTHFLETHLKPNELFFALPYEPLYYFLTNRPSPTRQLAFFEFMKISENEEKLTIKELETHKVNWILLSNRSTSSEVGLGNLGKTHCKLLKDYINSNFKKEIQLGDWENEAEWINNHGIVILKRIQPL